jgi:hypothetical protein
MHHPGVRLGRTARVDDRIGLQTAYQSRRPGHLVSFAVPVDGT